MYQTSILNEIYTNGFEKEFLNVFYIMSIVSGIVVIINKNPIISVLFLITLFLSISCYLMLLGLTFIGLSYLLVYVGAVSILFLFILMLINIRISELLTDTTNGLLLGVFVSIPFSYILYTILPYNTDQWNTNIFTFDSIYLLDTFYSFGFNDTIGYVTSNSWDGTLLEINHITSIGNIMYTSHLMWLILTSIILLLAMVGAIIITIKQK